jgi:hypothetical protein
MLKTEASPSFAVASSLREVLWTAGKAEGTETETHEAVAQATLAVLGELPFAPVWESAKRTCIPPTPTC